MLQVMQKTSNMQLTVEQRKDKAVTEIARGNNMHRCHLLRFKYLNMSPLPCTILINQKGLRPYALCQQCFL